MKTVEANGLAFGYLELGEGPLALCLHGFPDTAHTWRHLMPALADAGYRAVAPFQRGYAPTGIPADGAYQTGALVADANALHEALGGNEDAVVIGHDWGAAAVYGAVAAAPQRWRRGVAMSVPPFAAMASGFFAYPQLRRSFYIFLFQTPLAELAVNEDFIAGLWRDWSPGYDAASDVASVMSALGTPENVSAAIGYYRAMFDTSRHVARYAVEQEAASRPAGARPVLYLHGGNDGCLDVSLARDVESFLPPGSRFEKVPSTGHFLHLEASTRIEELVRDWLSVGSA